MCIQVVYIYFGKKISLRNVGHKAQKIMDLFQM